MVFAFGFLSAFLFGSQPTLSASSTRACTYDECHASGCDAASAPYLCVDPLKANYGCSALPWTELSCSDSCSLEGCSETQPSIDQETCRGLYCGDERCGTDYQVYYLSDNEFCCMLTCPCLLLEMWIRFSISMCVWFCNHGLLQ